MLLLKKKPDLNQLAIFYNCNYLEVVVAFPDCFSLDVFLKFLFSASNDTLLSLRSLLADDTPLDELVLLPFVLFAVFSLFWNVS